MDSPLRSLAGDRLAEAPIRSKKKTTSTMTRKKRKRKRKRTTKGQRPRLALFPSEAFLSEAFLSEACEAWQMAITRMNQNQAAKKKTKKQTRRKTLVRSVC